MADISITPANVLAGSEAVRADALCAEAIVAGKVVARDSDGNLALADADSADDRTRSPLGIALNGAAEGQPAFYLTSGTITLGSAVLTAGTTYYLSATPGGICPAGDLGSGDYPTIIGIAISADVLSVKIHESGVEL